MSDLNDTEPVRPVNWDSHLTGEIVETDSIEYKLFLGREIDSSRCCETLERIAQMPQIMPRAWAYRKRHPRHN